MLPARRGLWPRPAPMSTNAPVPHDPYAVWRNGNFRLLLASWLALVMASQIETVAVGVFIYDRTHNALALGWIGLVRALPVILLAIAAGQLADRYDRRIILLITLIIGAVAEIGLTALVYFGAPVYWLYAFLLLSSIGQALGSPARSALLPQLVPTNILSDAMAWNSSIFQLGTLIGPAIGGLLLGAHDYTPPAFALAVVLRLLAVVGIALVHIELPARKAIEMSWASVLAGIRFVWKTKVILATITLDLFAVLVGGATYLLPLYAEDILHVGGRGLGFLRSAEAIGAICMALALAHLPPIKRAGTAMFLAVAGFGLATILFGLSPWFWLSMLAMFLIGATDNISVVVRHTLVQVLTPDHMRGRVSAVNNVFILASNDLGGFESGASASLLGALAGSAGLASTDLSRRVTGAVASVVLGGLGALVVVAACAKTWPQVTRIGSLREIRPDEEQAALVEAAEELAERD